MYQRPPLSFYTSSAQTHMRMVGTVEKVDKKRKTESGFTLIEIISVFFLLSILLVTVIGGFKDSKAELRTGTQELRSHLRYAQARAMSTSTNWYVQFSSDDPPVSYSLYKSGDGIQSFPSTTSTVISIVDGLTVDDGTTSSGMVVTFDYLGRPYTDTAGSTVYSLNDGVRTIATSSIETVEIKPETGFIP